MIFHFYPMQHRIIGIVTFPSNIPYESRATPRPAKHKANAEKIMSPILRLISG